MAHICGEGHLAPWKWLPIAQATTPPAIGGKPFPLTRNLEIGSPLIKHSLIGTQS
jgi:hypothetical protein